MENEEKSVVSKFLEGAEENKFEPIVDSPFSEKEVIVEEKAEKSVPYHQDEKLQKYIDKVVEKRLKDMPAAQKEETKDEDDYYVRLIGNDTPEKVAMIKESKARDERMLQEAEERAFNRLSQKEQAALQEEEEAEEELNNAFETIEQTFDVDLTSKSSQKVRSEFLTYVEKIAPKDKDGGIVAYPDMNAAWETFNERRTIQPSRAKQLASTGLSRSSESASVPQKRITFDSADEYLDSLKN